MIIPIVLSAGPNTEIPTVYLGAGEWELRSNHKTAEISLLIDSSAPISLVHGMKIKGGLIKTIINHNTDRSITLEAHQCH